jgi:hypothetical protein
VLVAALLGAMAVSGPAAAYPPTTTTTIPTPNKPVPLFLTGNNGIPIGSSKSLDVCQFQAGTTASMSFEGAQPPLSIGSDGCGSVTIAASDPHVRINGGPLTAANYAGNVLDIRGTAANSLPLEYVVTFDILRSSPSNGGGATAGGSSAGGASGTSGSAGTTTTAGASGLAFTGADISAMVVGGLLLMAMGTLVVILTRRRRALHSD